MQTIQKRIRLFMYAIRDAIALFLRKVGLGVFIRPARFSLDEKLQKYLPDVGFYIEAGANDGYSESNTYHLEKKGWTGILVEPIPSLCAKCVTERPGSRVINAALVSNSFASASVHMHYGHLMSFVEGALSPEDEKKQIEKASYFFGDGYDVEVPAKTLTHILDEVAPKKIDFFSLDVEGYEMEVLGGMDFTKYRPTYLLIEHRTPEQKEKVETYIGAHYTLVEQLTPKDFLYTLKG